MFIILCESGEYSDYSVRMLGYVTEESKAKEIVEKKNAEIAVLFDLKDQYDNFRESFKVENPFKWKDSTSFEAEEEEMKEYEQWCEKQNEAIKNWLLENNVSEETSRQMSFLYNDRYKYTKIEEWKD